jgi:peptide/nickel transport system substrate-binding protein
MFNKIKRYQNDLRNGNLPRREFIKLATAAGISSTMLGSLLNNNAHAQTPKHGGRIKVGVAASQQNNSLDPARYFAESDILRGNALYDRLVNPGPDLLPVPHLAESWEFNADATKWVFRLRKGVQFHNGKPLTPEDVIYSFNHHLGEKSESPAKAYFSQVKELKKLDDHSVEFILKSPNAEFPMILADLRAHIIPDGYSDFTTTTIGTGPFKVKEFKPGSRYVFERNPNYWGSGGPYVDEIEYIGISDPTARVNALLSGDIDVMVDLDPKMVPLIKHNADLNLIQSKSGQHRALVMMLDRAPTQDKNLRMAMKYGIDREKILSNVFKGFGQVGNDHPISSIDPYYNHDIPQRVYDPDKARYYIKKAGLENKPLDVYTSSVTGAGSIPSCEIFQETARAGGINLNLNKLPADSYWTTGWMQKPICTTTWESRTPDLMFSIAYKSDAPWNETVWKNEHFDKLLLQARSVTDFNQRKSIYGEMQNMLQQDGGIIVMAFVDILDAANKKIKGITPNPTGLLGGYMFATDVWIDS